MLKSKVFVSCGQKNAAERRVARDVCALLQRLGFQPYLAINVQTITEINAGIIRELKDSDAYLFINFCREPISKTVFRGSVFSHQELGIAYALGFERLLIINQKGAAKEGMLRYIGNNTETFADLADCCGVVERAIDRAKWTTDYSRRLHTGELRWNPAVSYGNLRGAFLYLDIRNARPDIAAVEATARLNRLATAGGTLQSSPNRSPLKATARPGFAHTIFPKSHEAFDLICVGTYQDRQPWTVSSTTSTTAAFSVSGAMIPTGQPDEQVFLNCALDVVPQQPLPITPGVWNLEYEFFAINFPILTVQIELTIAPRKDPIARIVDETAR